MSVELKPSYPIDFPTESVQLVIKKLRGGEVETKCLIHAGWILQGFALQQFLPDDHTPLVGCRTINKAISTCDEAAAALEHCLMAHDTDGSLSGAAGFDWKGILSVVLNLIQQLLNNS